MYLLRDFLLICAVRDDLYGIRDIFNSFDSDAKDISYYIGLCFHTCMLRLGLKRKRQQIL